MFMFTGWLASSGTVRSSTNLHPIQAGVHSQATIASVWEWLWKCCMSLWLQEVKNHGIFSLRWHNKLDPHILSHTCHRWKGQLREVLLQRGWGRSGLPIAPLNLLGSGIFFEVVNTGWGMRVRPLCGPLLKYSVGFDLRHKMKSWSTALSNHYYKVGAMLAISTACSLRGTEAFYLSLAGVILRVV